MNYRAEVDGLRAIAVAPVVFFHAGLGWASGGFVGVDVFFVISGFLITSIIMAELEAGRFSMVQFYERRARRILPALAFMLFSCIPAAWLLMDEYELGRFAEGLLGVVFFASNIVFLNQDGYFEEASEFNPLLHTWSLAVEEQYYIFFPLLLLFVVKKLSFRKRSLTLTLSALTFISLVISIYSVDLLDSERAASDAFFLLPARIWELGIGALSALWLQPRNGQPFDGRLSGALAVVGLGMILIPMALYTAAMDFPGIASFAPVVGTGLVLCFGHRKTLIGTLLRQPVFVGVGLISYSLYLWHQPILAFYRIFSGEIEIPAIVSAVLIAIAVGLAIFSWRFVERPFRTKSAFSRASVFRASAFSLILLAAFGLVSLGASSGMEQRLARELEHSEYVFFGNVDERLFLQERLKGQLPTSDTVILGSSRLMLLSSDVLGRPLLNLSVSGAELEDHITFAPAAAEALGPRQIFIGADPWLLREQDPEGGRWMSVEALYRQGKQLIEGQTQTSTEQGAAGESIFSRMSGVTHDLYTDITLSTLATDDGAISAQAKRAQDGSHIYAAAYEHMGEDQRQALLPRHARYKMKQYRHSEERQALFMKLVSYLGTRGVEVTLVLVPYHPETYSKIKDEELGHVEAEARFRALGKELNVSVLGSYDPEQVGCPESAFYDGMHPRRSCIAKLLPKN